jgi:hypothetical protein
MAPHNIGETLPMVNGKLSEVKFYAKLSLYSKICEEKYEFIWPSPFYANLGIRRQLSSGHRHIHRGMTETSSTSIFTIPLKLDIWILVTNSSFLLTAGCLQAKAQFRAPALRTSCNRIAVG